MASQFQTIPQYHTGFTTASLHPEGDSSSDTPGGSLGTSGRYVFGKGTMNRNKRSSVDYSSATEAEIGYTSTASNSTYIPPFPMHHGQQFVSPTLYEHNQGSPISPQGMVSPGANMQSREYSTGQLVTHNGTNATSVAQSSSAATQFRRALPTTPPVPLACTECRLRHLKCDAGVPTCGRCRAEGRNCCYVKSRRGWKGRKRKNSTAGSTGGMTSGTEASDAGIKGESAGEGGYVGKFRAYLFMICSLCGAPLSLFSFAWNPLASVYYYLFFFFFFFRSSSSKHFFFFFILLRSFSARSGGRPITGVFPAIPCNRAPATCWASYHPGIII